MTAAALRPGDPSWLGSYELTGRLRAGGQGVVDLGRGPAGELVAIKILHGEVDESFLFRELSMARKVASFCTAQVLEAGVRGDVPYVVSEYVDGRSLSDVIEAEGPRTGGALDRLAIGTVTALAAIHQAEVVHRDFKRRRPAGPGRAEGHRLRDSPGREHDRDCGGDPGDPGLHGPGADQRPARGNGRGHVRLAVTMVYAATGCSPFGSDTTGTTLYPSLGCQGRLTLVPGSQGEAIQQTSTSPAATAPPPVNSPSSYPAEHSTSPTSRTNPRHPRPTAPCCISN